MQRNPNKAKQKACFQWWMKPGRGSASFCLLRRAFQETEVRIWSTWWINLHTQHLEWQAAKGLRGGILHTTCLLSSSLNYPSVFTAQLIPTSTYQSWIFFSCFSMNKMCNHLQIKKLLSLGRWARAAWAPVDEVRDRGWAWAYFPLYFWTSVVHWCE